MTPLSQRDPRWKDIKLGTGSTTISSHGCLITCLAMLAGTTPDVVNEELKRVGGYQNGNLVIWSALDRTNLGLRFIERSRVYNNEKVSNNLPCIVEVDGSRIGAKQHFVLYIGNKRMIDPWFGRETDTSYYPAVGYAIVKVDIIPPEPIAPPMDDIRLTILEANNIKTEGQLREVLGAWNDYTPLKNDLANARKEIEKLTQVENKYEELKKIHESVKDDFEKDLAEVEEKNRIYREFLVRLAKKVGSTQNIEDVEAKIGTLVKDSQELKEIQDDRPLVKHPFEGIGERLRTIFDLIIKWLKKKAR
jgi:hypothetical protein